MELSRLQEEEAQLEQSLLSGRVQLDSIIKSLKTTQDEINQVSADGVTAGYIRMICHFWPKMLSGQLLSYKDWLLSKKDFELIELKFLRRWKPLHFHVYSVELLAMLFTTLQSHFWKH